jgi:hypothetical protein
MRLAYPAAGGGNVGRGRPMDLDWKVVVGFLAAALAAGIAVPLLALSISWASKRYIVRRRYVPWRAAPGATPAPRGGSGVAGRSLLALQARLTGVRVEEECLIGEVTRLQAEQPSAAPDRRPRPSVPERAAAEAG